MASGTHKVMAPAAGVEKRVWVPWPSCQMKVTTPNAAANEIRLSKSALTGSQRDRSARVKKRSEATTMAAMINTRLRP